MHLQRRSVVPEPRVDFVTNIRTGFSQRLIEAGLHFEQAMYPRQKHGFGDVSSRHFYQRMEEFFDRHTRSPSGPALQHDRAIRAAEAE